MTNLQVQGRRSPRWAAWSRFTVPCLDGTDYLIRLRVLQTPWFGIYLHDIHQDDGECAPHNHPWSFFSVVLRGSYIERVYDDPMGLHDRWIEKVHKRFSIHRMGRVSAHRITYASPGLKTLILVGPRRASWGFFVDGEFVDWKDYERDYWPVLVEKKAA